MENLNKVARWRRKISPEDLQHVIALYDGGIRYTDAQLGRLFDYLERRGLLRSTLVIVTADHGEEFQEHGSMLHWQIYFTPNLHVPLLFFVPGRRPQSIDAVVELIDVLPTTLALLGLPPHAEAMGQSLVALMDGDANAVAEERVAYAEPFRLDMRWRTVVADGYQLWYDVQTGATRLFDLHSDPGVKENESEEAVRARLLAALEERQRRIDEAKRKVEHLPKEPLIIDAETREQLEALGYLDDE